jgi:hypothetical protein
VNFDKWLRRARTGCDWLAAVLLAGVSLRFAFVAVAQARNRPAPPPAVRLTPVPSPQGSTAGLSDLRRELEAIRALASQQRVGPAAETEPRPEPQAEAGGEPLRVTLVVSVGPDRSEVLVNGSVVGQSPFVGDLSCKRGEELRIDLLPKRGLPSRFTRACTEGTVRVGD